jgi:hypothetical protein
MPNTAGGTPTLPQELPVGKLRGAPEGIEEGMRAFGGTVAKSFVPGLGPADVILMGGGLDGQSVEALEEMLACRGRGRGGRWIGWGA